MENFLDRLKIHLIGEADLIVLGVGGLIATGSMFVISPILGVLALAVVAFVSWRFMRWIRVQDVYYTDTVGRVRCRKCQKVVYGDGESAHGAAENASRRGAYLRAYCDNRCGNWHLTSQLPNY